MDYYGLGIKLSHRNDRKEECPIAFASRTLTEAEKRFSQLEKKALSITYGVEKFRQYLLGRKFVLVTNNRPLIHIFSPQKPIPICASSRIKIWSLKLAAFNYTVEFTKTSDNSNVDQEHEANEWRPVAFASRTLTKTEQGYSQIEKEALAITWACERFKDLVVGKTFLIETDHKPLVPIFTTKDLNDLTPRLQRYH
ncbi:hypothetical protein LAZ67_2006790 [Cordylochernes scorpioides]|uniref:Reverse transcriptase RNase H-like domain-containing protein n=1 Tax=Cordylochernes scorpioides TaxID=51811 RepID=A0ABY6K5M4_9ARAC|nr:hypothetical protein LAZ67_2006790 [Cordylochernes scorpioides]